MSTTLLPHSLISKNIPPLKEENKEMKTVNLIITHKDCMDGRASAAVAMHHLKVDASHVFELGHCNGDRQAQIKELDNIGFFKKLNNVCLNEEGRAPKIVLWVLDHCLEQSVSAELLNTSIDRIIVLDHHQSTANKHITFEPCLSELADLGRYVLLFSMHYSGTALSWLFFNRFYGSFLELENNKTSSSESYRDLFQFFREHIQDLSIDYINGEEGKNVPALVKYIQDRDIWLWKHKPASEHFSASVVGKCKTLEDFIEVFPLDGWCSFDKDEESAKKVEEEILKLVEVGEAVYEYRMGLVMLAAETTLPFNILDKLHNRCVSALIVNTHGKLSSDLGNYLLKKYADIDLAIIWTEVADEAGGVKYELSFRSSEKFDCSRLAVSLGGGGHPRASGCKLSKEEFDNFYRNNPNAVYILTH